MRISIPTVAYLWLGLAPGALAAQDLRAIPDSPAQAYYDWWIGRWQQETEGRIDSTGNQFLVTRAPSGAIVEY